MTLARLHPLLELVANVSLDARLGDLGLGKDKRKKEFHDLVSERHDELFEDIWTRPPTTWPQFEQLATRFARLRAEEIGK